MELDTLLDGLEPDGAPEPGMDGTEPDGLVPIGEDGATASEDLVHGLGVLNPESTTGPVPPLTLPPLPPFPQLPQSQQPPLVGLVPLLLDGHGLDILEPPAGAGMEPTGLILEQPMVPTGVPEDGLMELPPPDGTDGTD